MSFYDRGVRFECTRCSRCCRHESGYVFLSARDLQRLAEYLSLSTEEVLARYCREVEVAGTFRISLKERSNFDCVFWEPARRCVVYEVRPLQCESFPFWAANVASAEAWEAVARRCPGIGRGALHSKRTIVAWLRRREQEGLLSVEARRDPVRT